MNQEGETCDDDQPDAEELKKFWGDIWSALADHNRDVKWLLQRKSMLQNRRR